MKNNDNTYKKTLLLLISLVMLRNILLAQPIASTQFRWSGGQFCESATTINIYAPPGLNISSMLGIGYTVQYRLAKPTKVHQRNRALALDAKFTRTEGTLFGTNSFGQVCSNFGLRYITISNGVTNSDVYYKNSLGIYHSSLVAYIEDGVIDATKQRIGGTFMSGIGVKVRSNARAELSFIADVDAFQFGGVKGERGILTARQGVRFTLLMALGSYKTASSYRKQMRTGNAMPILDF
jgi:hypothetical protein